MGARQLDENKGLDTSRTRKNVDFLNKKENDTSDFQ